MTQMYSVRSHDSWGIGDYGDLKRLLANAAEKSKADFMLINPIHAGAPIPPLEPSPYLPESRRFLNVTYIRPQDIPEYATLPDDVRAQVDALHASVAARNDESTPMDINAAWEAKRPALRLIFDAGRNNKRELEFEYFKATAGLTSIPSPPGACASRCGAHLGARTAGSSRRPSTTRPCRRWSRTIMICSSSTAGCSGSPPSR